MADTFPQEYHPVLRRPLGGQLYGFGMAPSPQWKCAGVSKDTLGHQSATYGMKEIYSDCFISNIVQKLEGIADGLLYLHSQWIVHGDIRCVSRLASAFGVYMEFYFFFVGKHLGQRRRSSMLDRFSSVSCT